MMKKTLIIGATTNPDRTAYQAAGMLKDRGHEFVPVGIKEGDLFGQKILMKDQLTDFSSGPIDTVTLYVRAELQKDWYEDILLMRPKRVIFNPGTENQEFQEKLSDAGIEPLMACTLVLLSTGQY